MKTIALIVAAGSSQRFGGEVPKQFLKIYSKPLLSRTIEKFQQASTITDIVVVVAEEFLLYTSEKIIDPYNFYKVTKIVPGGDSRRESVLKGLESLPLSTDYVAIHDAARMLISVEDIDKVTQAAYKDKAAILAINATDTVKRAADGFVISTLDRKPLFLAQTPQVFQYDLIINAHREFDRLDESDNITDDSLLIEKKGFKVRIVEPTSANFKITTKEDLALAEKIIESEYDG